MILITVTVLMVLAPAPRASAGHPLETDDPGTQGDRGASVETSVGLLLAGSPSLQVGLAGTVGLGDEVDVAVSVAGERAVDAQDPSGSLSPGLSLKWRMLGGEAWSLGVRLDAGLEVPSLGGVVLVSAGAPLTLLVSLGPSAAFHPGETSWALAGSVALCWSAGPWALGAELAGDLDDAVVLRARTQLALAWSPSAADTLSVGLSAALPLEPGDLQWALRVGWTVVLGHTG